MTGAVRDVLFVGAGGFLGAVLRYLVYGLAQGLTGSTMLPVGTLVVNVSGCVIIGLLAGFADAREIVSPGTRLFLFIGVLGGFTTFSTFGYETVALLRSGERGWAAASVMLHMGLALGGTWVGYGLTAR